MSGLSELSQLVCLFLKFGHFGGDYGVRIGITITSAVSKSTESIVLGIRICN